MVREFQEGTFEVSDSEYDETLQGLITYQDTARKGRITLIVSILVIIVLVGCALFYMRITQSTNQTMSEKLKNRKSVVHMTREIEEILKSPRPNAYQLRMVVERAIDITTTPVKEKEHPETPPIPEKQIAMFEAMEALLYLELEGMLDFDNAEDKKWYDTQLNRLGEQKLEFFEDGSKQSMPLLRSSWVRKEIKEEKGVGKFADTSAVEALEAQLNIITQTESFTILAPAYLLGRWYRYNGDLKLAEKCFDLSRRYVEGYSRGLYYYPGKRPKTLDASWDEYVGSLEALAEIAFYKLEFRKARSFLLRVFNTPTDGLALQLAQGINDQLTVVNGQILRTQQDIKIIKRAITSPMKLSSFPIFTVGDHSIDWIVLLGLLEEASQASDKAPIKSLWKALKPSTQRQIIEGRGPSRLNETVKGEIITALNAFVTSSDFYKKVSFDRKGISEKGQALLTKHTKTSLLPTETQFLNRDVLESTLSTAIVNDFVLSDGSRLSNALPSSQIKRLLELYEEEVRMRDTSEPRRRQLKEIIRTIYQSKIPASLTDLQTKLLDQKQHWIEQANSYEHIYDEERAKQQRLSSKVETLEQQAVVDLNEIRHLQIHDELSHNRQLEASIQRKNALQRLYIVENEIEELTLGLRQQLADQEIQLATLVQRQNDLRSKTLQQQQPLLEQLDKQVGLRRKYLKLLVGLQGTKGDLSIQHLHAQRESINHEIALIKTKLEIVSGNEREDLEIELSILNDQQHVVIKEFEEIFGPLRDVVLEIAGAEEEVWRAEQIIVETQKEIESLVGSTGVRGTVQEKSQKRAELLLMQSSKVVADPSIDLEIENLNDELAQDHSRLKILLQEEERAISVLEAFYPKMSDTLALFRQGSLAPLREYLEDQGELIDQYRSLRRENEIYKDIFFQRKVIYENIGMISKALEIKDFSEGKSNELSRYLQQILQARNSLRQDLLFLKSSEGDSFVQAQLKAISAHGIELDVVEMYQMESNIGLNINDYRKEFDRRAEVVAQLEAALIEKRQLETQQFSAARLHDQIQVDSLIPKISSLEDIINELSERELLINKKLRLLAQDYDKRWHRAVKYREGLQPQLDKLEVEIQKVQGTLVENDRALEQLGAAIFDTATKLNKQTTTLSVGDLSGLDEIIAFQEKELTRLLSVRDLKRRENYYRAKALWLIGKSYYEQSRLKNFPDLAASQDISKEMLEDEHRSGQPLFKEFDQSYLYSEDSLKQGTKSDDNSANFLAWVDFLEQSAIRVFQLELPKYLQAFTDSAGVAEFLEGAKQQDNSVFMMRSLFLKGKIYMNRAIRYMTSAAGSHSTSLARPVKNEHVLMELSNARAAFLEFLDFSRSSGYADRARLTELEQNSQEFPQRTRRPVKLLEDAQIYLGSIATLRGDYEKAIEYYRGILSGIATEAKVKHLAQGLSVESLPIGQVDPILLEAYQFEVDLQPYYVSLLSLDPLSHEVLYRLGRNYQLLAEREHDKFFQSVEQTEKEKQAYDERYRQYNLRGLAYYSQLILTQAYSPFRRAALLQRGLIKKELGDYSGSQEDLTNVLSAPISYAGSMEIINLSPKGDFPGELNPGRSYVAFELGKSFFESGDYAAAQEAFLTSRDEGTIDSEYVIKAKVAFGETLVKSKEWLRAKIFLQELLEEAAVVPERQEGLFPPELLIDLGQTNQALGKFTDAAFNYSRVFEFAPPELLTKDRQLDLSDAAGMDYLETDFRDSIRPLAIASQHLGELYLSENKFSDAKNYFAQAEKLYRITPWKEDRVLRSLDKEAYLIYKKDALLNMRWSRLKTDALELMNVAIAPFRQKVEKEARSDLYLTIEQMLAEVSEALKEVRDHKPQFEVILRRLDDLYEHEVQLLPEAIEKRRIEKLKERDQLLGTQSLQHYKALQHVADVLVSTAQVNPVKFISRLVEVFSPETMEHHLINNFVMDYAKGLGLTNNDRDLMVSSNSNIGNLIVIENPDERLKGFRFSLLAWLDTQMSETGFDETYIPVSPAAKLLEEVDLYRASFLSILDNNKHYKTLIKLASAYLEKERQQPNRIVNPENIWEIIELSAIAAEEREQWILVEEYNRFLLDEKRMLFFIQPDFSDVYRAEMGLANSLIHINQEMVTEIAFIEERLERTEKQAVADALLDEARAILEKLSSVDGENAVAVTTRIRAKELINQI